MTAVEELDPVVLVCASGTRAEQARGVLASAGLERLSVLEGGMSGWQQHDGGVPTLPFGP
ncbi:rhodanese-like domain-containing protein [Bounagaea algeriensis]